MLQNVRFVARNLVSWSRSGAIKSHQKGASHKEKIDKINNAKNGLAPLFFQAHCSYVKFLCNCNTCNLQSATPSTAAANTSASSSQRSQSSAINQLLSQQVATTRAEVIWVLRMIKNHNSFLSGLELRADLKYMFPNNDIVEKFTV